MCIRDRTGGVTISHLRFGDKPIKSPYYINKADFVACHNPSYITKGFKMAQKLKAGGTFLINSQWSFEELEHHLDADAKRYIAKNKIKLVMINAIDLAEQIGMGKRTNTIPVSYTHLDVYKRQVQRKRPRPRKENRLLPYPTTLQPHCRRCV